MGRYSLTKIRNVSANARNKSRYLEKSTEAWRKGRWIIEITGPYRVSWDGTVQSVKGTQMKRKSANEKKTTTSNNMTRTNIYSTEANKVLC